MAFVATAIGAAAGFAGIGGLTSVGMGALVGGTIGGAYDASQASKNAASTQAASADNATQVQWNMFQQHESDLAPYLKVGTENLNTLNDLMKSGNWQMDPGYQQMLKSGTQAIEGSSAPKWGSMSGATLKSLQDYGMGTASKEIGNIFNRYSSLAGIGQNAGNQIGAMGQNTANNVTDLITGTGNARAAGQIGSANAWNGGVNNLAGLMGDFNLSSLSRTGWNPTGPDGLTRNMP